MEQVKWREEKKLLIQWHAAGFEAVWFSSEGNFALLGDVSMSGDMFCSHNWLELLASSG